MRTRLNPVEALVMLPRLGDAAERRASWRQAVTALGQSVRVVGPPPLDGVEQALLVRSVQVVLESGLADDLDWIAPGSAAVALYEITASLPQGTERRELGRRVFARLYQGTATTFAAVASRMALGSGKPLDAATLHARVSLVFDLPIGSTVNADSLALSLVARRELFERWIIRPATGALPARRLAAKLFEHAAREAVTRSLEGDAHARELLLSDAIRPTFLALLSDREPLVWRHVAVARGLLATVQSRLREEIELALDPALTPTEWRRAAVSLAACLSGDAETAYKQCKQLLAGDVGHRDPGIAATMVWGLPRVIEAEPDAAEALLDQLAATRRPDVAEATAALLGDCSLPGFGARAAAVLKKVLHARAVDDSPLRGIAERALRSLDRADDDSIAARVRRALLAFETRGARAAHELAVEAMAAAHTGVDRLLAEDAHSSEKQHELLAVLDDIDTSALERSRLGDLLLLGRRPGETDASVPELERLYDRLGGWALDAEERVTVVEWSRGGSLANQRRLRALLHLLDLETAQSDSDAIGVRARVRRSVQLLLERLAAGPDGMVHRILCATLARSFDAAVREAVAEPSDLLLVVAGRLDDRHTVEAIAEGSTHPEVSSAIQAYAAFLNPLGSESSDGGDDSAARDQSDDLELEARRLILLSHGIGAGSYRSEALRQVLLRMGRALEHISTARGLTELVDAAGTGTDPIGDLESAADALRRLGAGAARRLLKEGSMPGEIAIIADVAPLSALVERAVSAGVPANSRQISMAVTELSAELPAAVAASMARVLGKLDGLPVSAASDVYVIPLEKRRAALPDWLLPRRTIGAFYVVRSLGSGGGSSVFVARRLEERNDSHAEQYALKVPQYDPTTARSLSEQEFLQLFREEAGALLSLPQHGNLARFVTFDLAAKPKPILVMELIRGVGLDRLIRSRALTAERAFAYCDGILQGLEAMHGAGVGHLDLKPSNVILRDGETPVLVDFGLSGRHLRPGCGTLEYCAPEVLGIVPDDYSPSPLAVDMYAFACLSFELLTADLLFDADDEQTLVSMQVSHDGWPPKLAALATVPSFRKVGIVLAACLRRDPRARPSSSDTRRALRDCAAEFGRIPWPLVASRAAQGMSA